MTDRDARKSTATDGASLLGFVAGYYVLMLMFRIWDWGMGVPRAGLVVAVGTWCALFVLWCRRRKTVRGGPRLVCLGMLCLGILGVARDLGVGVFSVLRTVETQEILLDQGQVAHDAVQYTRRYGLNPYSADLLVELDTAGAVVRRGQATGCMEGDGFDSRAIAEALRQQRPVEDVRDMLPPLRQDERCTDALGPHLERLAYKKGPLQFVCYFVFVSAFGRAGIYVSHILAFVGLLVVLVTMVRRLGGGWLLLGPVLVVTLRPDHIGHNTLHLSASDIFPVGLSMLALHLLLSGRPRGFGVVLALAMSSKLLPGLLYLPLLSGVRRRHWWTFLVPLIVFHAPFAAWDWDGFLKNAVFHSLVRRTDSTALVHYLSSEWRALSLLAVLAGVAFFYLRAWRARWSTGRVLAYLTAAHLGVYLTGSFFHNNYLVWITPLLGFGTAWALASGAGARRPRDERGRAYGG
jgi:hypothetical protein